MASVKPKVMLFQDDYERFKRWVLLYPDCETGGQLFGLWTHDKKPYINIVIGPGVHCRHGTHSFHQDIGYLSKVGEFLNAEFMMCHIGEWHSHHQLRLRQPSSGDLNSIWKHFPAGVENFLLIIATIEDGDVRLNPWFFTAATHTHENIEVEIIEKDNVFMKDDVVDNKISDGAEIHGQYAPKDFPQSSEQDWYNEWEFVPDPLKNEEHKKPGTKIKSSEKNENLNTKWHQGEWGSIFIQVLHSELEKRVVDPSTKITMSFEKESKLLQFTFQRKTCKVTITFPPDFPHSALAIVCLAPGSLVPLEHYVFKKPEQTDEAFIDKLVHRLKDLVPQVIRPAAMKYAAVVK